MYNLILQTIAYIAIIWFLLTFIFSIGVYILFRITYDTKYVCLTKDIYFANTEYDDFYIIPTISVHFGTHPQINIIWLIWSFSIYYHIKTEKEEEIEATVRRKMNENDKS